MPCEARMRQKFEVIRQEVDELRKANSGELPFEKKDEKQRALEDLYVKTKQKLDEHMRELEKLRKRLRETTSELEKARLQKEIEELEGEVEKFKDTLEQMVEFMRDLERRTISQPSQQDE